MKSKKPRTTLEQDDQFLKDRRIAYNHALDPRTPHGKMVLEDLADFCFANKSTMHSDARAQAAAEGRRDVWLRIQYHLNLTDEQFWELYGRARPE